jgi:hypothetical protein
MKIILFILIIFAFNSRFFKLTESTSMQSKKAVIALQPEGIIMGLFPDGSSYMRHLQIVKEHIQIRSFIRNMP